MAIHYYDFKPDIDSKEKIRETVPTDTAASVIPGVPLASGA